jgi:hypothetical protein
VSLHLFTGVKTGLKKGNRGRSFPNRIQVLAVAGLHYVRKNGREVGY